MSQGIDKRIIRSRKALLCALPFILAEKPLERVTVREVAEAAGINRKTFYAHYSTPDELHSDLAKEIVNALIHRMGERDPRPADFVAAVASLARDYREEISLFMLVDNLSALRSMVLRRLTTELETRLFPTSDRKALCAAGLIGITMGLYTAYLSAVTPVSLPVLEELHLNLINRGFV